MAGWAGAAGGPLRFCKGLLRQASRGGCEGGLGWAGRRRASRRSFLSLFVAARGCQLSAVGWLLASAASPGAQKGLTFLHKVEYLMRCSFGGDPGAPVRGEHP